MAFFSHVSLLLALLSVTRGSRQKVQLGLERAETGNGYGALVFYGVAFKLDLSATLSPGHPCAVNKPNEDNDACVKEVLKENADATAAGGISTCAQLAKAEWCTAPVPEDSTFFGNACPVSCHWDKCEDHNAQFKQECEGKEACKKAPHENCNWAVSDGWCASESKAGGKLGESIAHWMHWICRKSCCEKTGGKHHTCGKVCEKEKAKPAEKPKVKTLGNSMDENLGQFSIEEQKPSPPKTCFERCELPGAGNECYGMCMAMPGLLMPHEVPKKVP